MIFRILRRLFPGGHSAQGWEKCEVISKNAIEVDFAISSGIYRFLYLKSGLGVDLLFVVVADKKAIDVLSRRDDDLYALIEYAEKNGTTEIAQSAANRFTIGFSNDSVFEDEFYKTISHYCTI